MTGKRDGRPVRAQKLRSGLGLIDSYPAGEGKFVHFALGYHRPATRDHHGNRFIRDHAADRRVANPEMGGKFFER